MTNLNVSKLSMKDIVSKVFENGRNAIAAALLNDEDVMDILRESAQRQVADFRRTAREIQAQMFALKDPDTQELEPMERLEVQRSKMVVFAGRLQKLSQMLRQEAVGQINESGRITPSPELVQLANSLQISVAKTVLPGWMTGQADALDIQIAQGAQEIKALSTGELAMYEDTYTVLQESYEVAMSNLAQAEQVLREIELKAPGILLAIETHKNALILAEKTRDRVDDNGVNNFMDDLTKQMTQARATYRADHVVEDDLNARKPVSFADMASALPKRKNHE